MVTVQLVYRVAVQCHGAVVRGPEIKADGRSFWWQLRKESKQLSLPPPQIERSEVF